jgi:signal transduction histidine kinase
LEIGRFWIRFVIVYLFSDDEELKLLCKELLQGHLGGNWVLSTDVAGADLSVWDFDEINDSPKSLGDSSSRHVVLIHEKNVGQLSRWPDWAEATVLLKPVTQPILSAVLNLAICAQREHIASATLKTDRDEILQCLIQANLKLQDYDQNRTNFLARAMHDLGVPLTAVNGYCGLLLSEALGPLQDDQKSVLLKMHESNLRLSRMASAMFQLSISRQGKGRLDVAKEDMRECIEQCIREITPAAEGKRIAISLNLNPAAPMLYFERNLLEQALMTLLDNSCKFTPKAGEIKIEGYPFFWERRYQQAGAPLAERRRQDFREPNGYRIDITNSGKPIPKEHLADIFEEYTSYSGDQDRSGGGLGLAICRMIITQHEGCVWAENTTKGSRFSFILPARFGSVRTWEVPQEANTNGGYAEVRE